MALNLQKETVVKLVEKLEEVKGGNAANRSFGNQHKSGNRSFGHQHNSGK